MGTGVVTEPISGVDMSWIGSLHLANVDLYVFFPQFLPDYIH